MRHAEGDLRANESRELERLVRFAGIKGVSTETLQAAVGACTFENMRRLESANALGSSRLAPRDEDERSTYKTREGRIASYVDYLEPPEIAHIESLIAARLHEDYAFYKR